MGYITPWDKEKSMKCQDLGDNWRLTNRRAVTPKEIVCRAWFSHLGHARQYA